MRSNEAITFKVNGYAAISPQPALWQNGLEPAWADLLATRGLPPGVALASLEGKYHYVLGEEGTYSPDPGKQFLNSLARLEPGRAYFLRMKQEAELVVWGARLPADSSITLGGGWRWVGYLPAAAGGLPEALGSIAGRYDYLLGESGTYAPLPSPHYLNTLGAMEPGRGYLLRMIQPGILVYGAGRLTGTPTATAAATPAAPTGTPTPGTMPTASATATVAPTATATPTPAAGEATATATATPTATPTSPPSPTSPTGPTSPTLTATATPPGSPTATATGTPATATATATPGAPPDLTATPTATLQP